MKERPILFTGEMVRAILDGRKTQTRRPFKFRETNQPPSRPELFNPKHVTQPAPLGTIGDRLWVREKWAPHCEMPGAAIYRCDRGGDYQDTVTENFRWRPSIHMPRWASRIDLEITAVRVERAQEITEEDAKNEGVSPDDYEGYEHPDNPTLSCAAHRYSFRDLWQSIYANWDANPWVWVYEFRRVKP